MSRENVNDSEASAEDIKPSRPLLFASRAHRLPADSTHYMAGLMSLGGTEQLLLKWKTDQDWAIWSSTSIKSSDVTDN